MSPRQVEIELHKFLQPLKNRSFLLGVSGGLDSMALFYAFLEMSRKWQMTWAVCYVHHGSGSPDVVSYRQQAYDVVKDVCEKYKIPFYSNVQDVSDLSSIPFYGASEAGFRQLRGEVLLGLKRQISTDFIVLAHHKDDLLETRLMRLIRGCGPQGLTAMYRKQGSVLRPFLPLNRSDLVDYMRKINGHWVEDPTNEQSAFLRNWVRNEWLPQLEKKCPGSKAVLANSLQLIASALPNNSSLVNCFDSNGRILRSELLSLNLEDKKRVFAIYLKRQNVKNYGLSHVNELVKRLDVEQKELTFKMAQKNWLANARHIWCED